jgi:hypothetical protein
VAALLRRAGGELERAVGILFQEPPNEAEEATLIAREHASDSGVAWVDPTSAGGVAGGVAAAAPSPLRPFGSTAAAGGAHSAAARNTPSSRLRVSINLFREPVSHSVDAAVPKPQRFIETIDEVRFFISFVCAILHFFCLLNSSFLLCSSSFLFDVRDRLSRSRRRSCRAPGCSTRSARRRVRASQWYARTR